MLFNEINPTINADDTKGGSGTFSLTIEAQVAKKYAIYLPKAIVQTLNLKEGAKVLLRLKLRSTIRANRVLRESVKASRVTKEQTGKHLEPFMWRDARFYE